jgi:hypothetical protein
MYPNQYFWYENIPSGNPILGPKKQSYPLDRISVRQISHNRCTFVLHMDLHRAAFKQLHPVRVTRCFMRKITQNIAPTQILSDRKQNFLCKKVT